MGLQAKVLAFPFGEVKVGSLASSHWQASPRNWPFGNTDMRVSDLPDNPVNGNAVKYQSYREAWARIGLACRQNFFLEAITLEESIISSRLISFLIATGTISRPSRFPQLHQLLNIWKKASDMEGADLRERVDQWRKQRNLTVHGIVKAFPGEPSMPVEDFLKIAKQTADEGRKLARAVCKWCERRVKENKRPATDSKSC